MLYNNQFEKGYYDREVRPCALIGMAHVEEDYPLYYEAVNEKGLGIAGLNFVGNSVSGVHGFVVVEGNV